LCSVPTSNNFVVDPWQGPYHIIRVNDNANVGLKMNKVVDTVIIQKVKVSNQQI
jgi:hypothetical protein